MAKSPIERFNSKINITPTCWIWTAYIDKDGYGRFSVDGRMTLVHRFSYEFSFGKILEGMCICHKCDNPGCSNPQHLFLGTNSDNSRDMVLKSRQQKGESSPNARLSDAQVLQIRNMWDENGRESLDSIAALYSISKKYVFDIVRRRNRKNI